MIHWTNDATLCTGVSSNSKKMAERNFLRDWLTEEPNKIWSKQDDFVWPGGRIKAHMAPTSLPTLFLGASSHGQISPAMPGWTSGRFCNLSNKQGVVGTRTHLQRAEPHLPTQKLAHLTGCLAQVRTLWFVSLVCFRPQLEWLGESSRTLSASPHLTSLV